MSTFDGMIEELKPGTVALLGVPFDENASFMRGAASAPQRIRETLHSGSCNICVESGVDLEGDSRWHEFLDLEFSSGAEVFDLIHQAVRKLLARDIRVLALGGDHNYVFDTGIDGFFD